MTEVLFHLLFSLQKWSSDCSLDLTWSLKALWNAHIHTLNWWKWSLYLCFWLHLFCWFQWPLHRRRKHSCKTSSRMSPLDCSVEWAPSVTGSLEWSPLRRSLIWCLLPLAEVVVAAFSVGSALAPVQVPAASSTAFLWWATVTELPIEALLSVSPTSVRALLALRDSAGKCALYR